MKLSRNLNGPELVVVLKHLGYNESRQSGSHVRMTVHSLRQGHLTVPLTKALPAGTLASLIKAATAPLETAVEAILRTVR